MPQLKPSFIAKINQKLDNSNFTKHDFDIDLPDSGKLLARIVFRYNNNWHISYYEEEVTNTYEVAQKLFGTTETRKSKNLVNWIRVSPGKVKNEAVYDISNADAFLDAIPNWCDDIRTELSATTERPDPVAELRQQLQEKLDSLIDDPEAQFTQEELDVVDKRFDKLLSEIEELREKYAFSETKISELQKAFDEFKSTARTYPKGMWARLTANKLVKSTGSIVNSPEGRKFIFEGLKKAIGLSDGS